MMEPGKARKAADYARLAYGWKGVLARTAGYCTVSVAARALTGSEQPSQKLMHRFFRGSLRQLGIRVEADGAEKIRPATPCIIAVNHNSYLDIPCVGVLLDFDYKWVSKKEVFRWPFVGWHLWACGHIWVDRERRDNSERLAEEFHRVLNNGASILMFPEGTRSPDGRLLAFKRGAFVTAVTEGVPVLPIALDGTERLMEKGSLEFPHGQDKVVRIKVMDPVHPPTAGAHDERVTWMRDRTREAMVAALDELRGAPGAAERPTL
jgi:1-acyl-sn-glycerol-3-phosphate acyltransferase